MDDGRGIDSLSIICSLQGQVPGFDRMGTFHQQISMLAYLLEHEILSGGQKDRSVPELR